MMFMLSRVIPCGVIVVLAAGYGHAGRLHAASQTAGAQVSTSDAFSATSSRALLTESCVTCHNEKLKTAGLMLDKADIEHVGAGADLWEKVVLKVRSGAMPPAGRRRPDKTTFDGFATWLERELDREGAAHPNPGRPADHRLNQAEYSNAIRDLLALDTNAGSLLPADESDHGFDNIADVLSISPTLLERYVFAAKRISRLAVGDPTIAPAIQTFNISRSLRQNERMHDDLPYGTRGGASFATTSRSTASMS